MYSLGAWAPASHWSSSHRLQEDTERGSRCSDSWSSCDTSGKESGYRHRKGKNAERHCLNTSSGPHWYPLSCLLLCSLPPFSCVQLIQASLTLIPPLSLHSPGIGTHKRSGDLHLAVLLLLLQSLCIRDCVCVYVREAARGWAGGWMSGWIWQREEGGGGGAERGGVRAGEKSRVAELLHRQRPP